MISKVIIIVLVVLNGFLLFKFSSSELDHKPIKRSLYELENYGLEHFQDSARIKILNNYKGEGVFGLTFINEMGCFSCIQNEIILLNNNTDLQEKILVIGVSNKEDYFRKLGLNYKYIHFSDLGDIYKKRIPIGNPFTIVLDKNFVYDFNLTNTSKPHSKEMRKAYYGFLQAYFNK
ncbi:MAG: hypothetical protein RIC57_05380 [Balneola sp.]|jgi:hypothetical protein|tara:strand:- start:13650 stop:14177 length:528 start_codon:yes stop_codon:yes gene_type:complete